MTKLDRPVDQEEALTALRACIGALHRLAWSGPDEHGDRLRAHGVARAAVDTLNRTNEPLAAVVDWWMVAALGADPLGGAWSIDRLIRGSLGEVLRAFLDFEGPRRLDVVRRPARFREVIESLEQLTKHNPGKIAAEKAIYNEVFSQCRQLLRASESKSPPPTGLRIATATDADLEAWAGESSGGVDRVEPGTPIWNKVVKQLIQRRDLAAEAIRLWPRASHEAPTLPTGWSESLDMACEAGADIAKALVEDALPEPGPRPLFDARIPKSRPPHSELFWFALAREKGELPGWARTIQTQVGELSERLDECAVHYRTTAADQVAFAKEALGDLKLEEARTWLAEAEAEHARATHGADEERVRERATERSRALLAIGHHPPPEHPDLQAWAHAVDEAWSSARNGLRQSVRDVLARIPVRRRDHRPLRDALDEAERCLQSGLLEDAHGAVERAWAALAPLEEEEAKRLGADLWALARSNEDLSIRASIERAAARRAAGLDVNGLVQDLTALIRDPQGASAVCVRGERVAWVYAGTPTSGAAPAKGVRLGELFIGHGSPADAAERVGRWGWLVDTGAALPAHARVFLRLPGAVEGPYVARSGELVPEHPAMAVARIGSSEFERLFGRVPLGHEVALVPHPPSLDELLRIGGSAVDRLDEATLAEWLASELDGAPSPEAIRAWLDRPTAQLPDVVRDARLARLDDLLGRASALRGAREEAVSSWLASDAGRSATERAAETWVERHSEDARRRLAARVEQHAEAERALDAARAKTEQEKEALQEEIAAVEELLQDRKLKLFAEIGGLRPGGAVVAPVSAPPEEPLRAAPFVAGAPPSLAELSRIVAGKTWSEVDVANLLLSMGTGRWTLLAGLPGVGKSTFVRSVLTRLGHGPGSDRYLELVVRRDWQDDAALFGFWHPTERRWMPSSEGFLEHLLRASAGAVSDGIWPVLVEELNLASPEYYLARMLSAFEAADPSVRLYDPDLRPANANRYPAAVPVPGAVRVLGTVNVDDTVERLSPRFLSRASVVWVDPSVDAPMWRAEDDATGLAVPFTVLDRTEEADLGPLLELVGFLQDQRVPGAPTARTRRAIGRYLCAARGVLPSDDAQDLQVVQRILPPLRGVGPRWRSLLDRLVEMFERHHWRRAATRTRTLRERGEELGDWYDFFHT